MSEAVAAARGDRFILRRPSPPATLGGGTILDPHPGRRHRRFRADVADRLETLAAGSPEELLTMTLSQRQPISQSDLINQSGIDSEAARETLAGLLELGQVRDIAGLLITDYGWRELQQKTLQILAGYHTNNPLRLGMPREELRSRLGLTPQMFNNLIAACEDLNTVRVEGKMLRTADHELTFSAEQEQRIDAFFSEMKRAGANTPSVKESQRSLGENLYYALIDLGRLRQLNAEVVYESQQYEELTAQIVTFLKTNGKIDAAQTRDLLQTSRKYAIALLEHLDDIKLTKRVDDRRILV